MSQYQLISNDKAFPLKLRNKNYYQIEFRMSSDGYNNTQGHYFFAERVGNLRDKAKNYCEEYNYREEEINIVWWIPTIETAEGKPAQVLIDWRKLSPYLSTSYLLKFALLSKEEQKREQESVSVRQKIQLIPIAPKKVNDKGGDYFLITTKPQT